MSRFSALPQKAIWGTSANNAYLLGLSGIDALDEQVLRVILHHSRGRHDLHCREQHHAEMVH